MLKNAVWVVNAALVMILLVIGFQSCRGSSAQFNKIGVESGDFYGYTHPDAQVSTAPSTNNSYDREFREQTRSSPMKSAGGGAGGAFSPYPDDTSGFIEEPYDPFGDGGQTEGANIGAAPPGIVDKIESWFVPKAYAEDHGLDEQYLVRTGDCSLKVENFKDAAGMVDSIAAKHEGVVTDSRSQQNSDDTVNGWIRLRIPNERFFDAWVELLEIGEVTEESTTSEDVSQQYVGYVSRLKNLMQEQDVLNDMLEEAREVQKTRGLGEAYSVLLQTHERLSNVTGEIESTEDLLSALADKVTRSTITVNLTEVKKLPEQVREQFTWGLSEAAGQGFKDLKLTVRNALQNITYFLITCWTWVIPWAIVIFIAVRIWKRWLRVRLMDLLAKAKELLAKKHPAN